MRYILSIIVVIVCSILFYFGSIVLMEEAIHNITSGMSSSQVLIGITELLFAIANGVAFGACAILSMLFF
jgi:hypothetical protein